MQRRQILKLLGANLCVGSFAQVSSSPAVALPDPKWGYVGNTGPEHWSELSPAFQLCQTGRQQTPIDLAEAAATETELMEISYQPTPLSVTNTARTIQVNYEPGSFMTFRGEKFQLLQFHFHHPSEHRVFGKSFDLEMHLVHRSAAGKLAVMGVFIQTGAFNPKLKPIWDAMPAQPETVKAKNFINVAQLLPSQRQFYEYRGSLTTPPCSEDVLWFVITQPIAVSAEQVQQFATLFPLNARPIQSRGDRVIRNRADQ